MFPFTGSQEFALLPGVILECLFFFIRKAFHSPFMNFFKYPVYFLLLICYINVVLVVDCNGV